MGACSFVQSPEAYGPITHSARTTAQTFTGSCSILPCSWGEEPFVGESKAWGLQLEVGSPWHRCRRDRLRDGVSPYPSSSTSWCEAPRYPFGTCPLAGPGLSPHLGTSLLVEETSPRKSPGRLTSCGGPGQVWIMGTLVV